MISYNEAKAKSKSHNLRLGLVTDGVNPYGEKRNNWSK
jgi:hypothetical protein